METNLNKIIEIKSCKGKSAAAFDILNKARGRNKQTELIAMKDPLSGELILDPASLKVVALKYCVNLLQNNLADSDYVDEIHTENLLHYFRSNDLQLEDVSLEYSDFEKRMSIVASKHGKKYDFLLKSGQGLKSCLFNIF